MPKLPPSQTLVDAYLITLARPNTRNGYRMSLLGLMTWLEDNGHGHIAQMTTPLFHLYADHVKNSGVTHNTLVKKLGPIKRFFDYLVSSGTLPRSPVPEGWVPRQSPRNPNDPIISLEQVRTMRVAASRHSRPLDAEMAVSLAGLDGVKVKYIFDLQASDVIFRPDGQAVIPCRRTNGTVHPLVVSPDSSSTLRKAIQERPTGSLFLPIDNYENRRRTALRVLSRTAVLAGVKEKVTFTGLDRSYRARLLEAGVPLEAVIERIGRSSRSLGYEHALFPKHGPGTEGGNLLQQAVSELDALELLKQAEHLCDQEGVTPIAPIVIAGAALEMVLRRMCDENGVVPKARNPGINAYSEALRARSLISKHDHFVNQSNGDLRNDAAHGKKTSSVSMANARLMIQSIALFLSGEQDE